uniref:KiSS-1 receptor n=1 Tax=Magallana gigas TaxID=29159 RepID=K1R8Z6_MAGGI
MGDQIQPLPILFTWSLLTFVGLVGNSVVIYITCLHAGKSATNTYILNLAVSDIAYLIVVVPFTCLAFIFNHWVFAEFGFSILLSLPFAIFHKEMQDRENTTICGPDWPSQSIDKAATLAVVMTSYVIPLAAIIACYSRILLHLWRGGSNRNSRQTADANGTVPLRSAGQLRRKKRVTRMVAIVILLFAWCWLPIQFFTLWYKFDPNFPQILALLKFKIFAHTLSYANSCVNPFVYAFMNEGVRKAFKKKFPSASIFCHCFKKPKMTNPETSTMIDKAVMTTRGGGVESMATTHCSL